MRSSLDSMLMPLNTGIVDERSKLTLALLVSTATKSLQFLTGRVGYAYDSIAPWRLDWVLSRTDHDMTTT